MTEQPEGREPATVLYLPTAVWPAPEGITATEPSTPADTIPEARPATDEQAVLDSAKQVLGDLWVNPTVSGPTSRQSVSVTDSARLVLGPDYPDLMGDKPLVPAWTKSSAGWKARGYLARVNSVRGFRRWVRRQNGEHGHVAQIARGIARTADWVEGSEGARLATAKHELNLVHKQYKAAKWDHNKRMIPGSEKERRRKKMEAAFQESEALYGKLKKARSDARRGRLWRAATVLSSIAGLEGTGFSVAGMPGGLLATTVTLTGFALIGRRTSAGEVYSDGDAKIGDGVKPSAEVLDKAMREAGILKASHAVTMRLPAALDGKAWVMPVALSGGPTVATVRAHIEELAAAFGVPVYQVDVIDSDDGRGDQFTLWVSTVDPFRKVFVSPLVDKPVQVDAFGRGVLVGYNRREEPIYLKMGHVMALLGGASRTGKGMLLRNLICGLGLDPSVNLRLVAGAKPGEHAGYAPVCATFFGRDPYRLIILLEELLEEGKRREDILIDRKKAKASARDLDEFPLEVLIIDEYKQYAASDVKVLDPNDPGDPDKAPRMMKACDRIAGLLEELAAFVAALNITIMLSTQDPDANTIPRGFKSNSIARVATRTMGAVQTNAILKDGATGAGMVAHEIPKSLKGTAIVDIDGYEGEIIRSCFIEDEKYDGAADIIEAGASLRSKVGRAPGQFSDPIEDALAYQTGYTSVAGGKGGFGRPSPVHDNEEVEISFVEHMVKAASMTGRGEITRSELFAYLASEYNADYAKRDGESGPQHGSRVGKLLKEALAEMGVSIDAVKVKTAEGAETRGYRLEDLQGLS